MTKNKFILLLLITFVGSGSDVFAQKDSVFTNIQEINSIKDDYLPFLTDSVLLFTSNRKNTQEGQMLEYTDKTYWSKKKAGIWSAPSKNGYKWNSDNNSSLIGVSPDYYFYYRSYFGVSGEIFAAKRKQDTAKAWKAEPLKKLKSICSEFDENSIAAGKGDTLYFTSNRRGNYDIYVQSGKNIPVLVDSLNTDFDEVDVFISPDYNNLYFSSNRPGGKGDYDIYQSTRINNKWSSPVHLESMKVNSDSADRDYRKYNDSTMFLSSNRSGGKGNFDIYMLQIKTIPDTIPPPVIDSVVVEIPKDTVVPVADTLTKERDELIEKLKELGLFPFQGEVQVGAYRYIKEIDLFKQKFPCVKDEDLRRDTLNYEKGVVYKYIINKVYTDIDEALNKQLEVINRHCLPEEEFSDMPFIGMLDKDKKRYAIFWKKDEFLNKNIFYIFENGKQIWKGRRF